MGEKKENPEKNLEKRKKEFQKESDSLKKKYNIDIDISLTFPQYKILPVEVELAVAIINKQIVNYHIGLKEMTNDNEG